MVTNEALLIITMIFNKTFQFAKDFILYDNTFRVSHYFT